jgi:hypothetical protein
MLISVSLGSISAVAAVMGLVQYPLYGVFAAGTEKKGIRWLTIVTLHFVAALIAALLVQRSGTFG